MLVAAGMTASVLAGATSIQAGQTITFGHRDAQYLWPGQRQGGLAYVPETVVDPTVPVPLVVFLHGTNPEGTLHNWFGGGGYDLRDHIEQFARAHDAAFVVSAPSNTRRAGFYKNLWQGFDASAFVEDTARALQARALIDENRVFVFGHSAAGCNLEGGLLSASAARGRVRVKGLFLVDTCLDGDVARRLVERWNETPLWVTWQDVTWKREPDAFSEVMARGLAPGSWFLMQRIDTNSLRPHTSLVLPSLLRLLTQWVINDEGVGLPTLALPQDLPEPPSGSAVVAPAVPEPVP